MLIRIVTLCLILLASSACCAQMEGKYYTDSTIIFLPFSCKYPEPIFIISEVVAKSDAERNTPQLIKVLTTSFNGRVSFEHFQRESKESQFFLGNNVSNQVVVDLSVLWQQQYPFNFSLKYTESSPFQLEDKWQFSFSFDEREYTNQMKEQILLNVKNRLMQERSAIASRSENEFKKWIAQRNYINSPQLREQVIKKNLFNELSDSKVVTLPSGVNAIFAQKGSAHSLPRIEKEKVGKFVQGSLSKIDGTRFKAEQRKLDSLYSLYKRSDTAILQFDNRIRKALDSVSLLLADADGVEDLKKIKTSAGLSDSGKTAPIIRFLAKTSFRAGNFLLNQSELTVNGLLMKGASVRLGNSSFMNVSAGKYDFQFRHLFGYLDSMNERRPALFAVKFGKGEPTDLKAVNLYFAQKSSSFSQLMRTIAGVSVERTIRLSRMLKVHAEVAKSTEKPSIVGDKDRSVTHLFTRFDTKTIAVNTSLEGMIKKTSTDFQIEYTYAGHLFESMNASSFYNPKSRLGARMNQPLFNRRVNLTSGIRYLEYASYGIATNVGNKSYFATASATIRLKSMPVIYVGYFPGSQLYLQEGKRLYQYVYYNLHASAHHNFNLFHVPVNGTASYNKLLNKFSDSAATGNQDSYNLFLTTWIKKFTLVANYSFYQMEKMRVSVFEAGTSYTSSRFSTGGTVKYNVSNAKMELGYSSHISLKTSKLGSISFFIEKSFLPDRSGRLIPIQSGRIQLIKPLKFNL